MQIGVTVHLTKEPRSLWGSGADQNCLFLLDLLRRVPGVERVYAVNGADGDALPPGAGHFGAWLSVVRPEDVADKLDVLIQCGTQLPRSVMRRVVEHGGKLVAYKFGNEFVINTERAIHDKPCPTLVEPGVFDEIWTTQQHVDTCAAYWETLYRSPVRVLPHIWSPTFVDLAAESLQDGARFGYEPGRQPKRLAIYEPNVNIVKTAVLPMLVCDAAYRVEPSLIDSVFVCCANKVKSNDAFRRLASALDLVRDHRMSFEARYPFPWFQAKHADVVVSHQWENGLNYAYYEALYGRYPLVHNSDLLPDGVGYRYHGFDCRDGGLVLQTALAHHDEPEVRAEYDRRADEFLSTVRADAPANIEAHRSALARLTERRLAA